MFLALFVVSFVSATLWPVASEAMFVLYLHQNNDALLTLLITASAGNSLGAIVMYELAGCSHSWVENKVQGNSGKLNSWFDRLTRYGSPLLVLAWLPVVGDLLPISAGVLGIKRLPAYSWLVLGKTLRYVFLVVMVMFIGQ